jgi:hypothetical protein
VERWVKEKTQVMQRFRQLVPKWAETRAANKPLRDLIQSPSGKQLSRDELMDLYNITIRAHNYQTIDDEAARKLSRMVGARWPQNIDKLPTSQPKGMQLQPDNVKWLEGIYSKARETKNISHSDMADIMVSLHGADTVPTFRHRRQQSNHWEKQMKQDENSLRQRLAEYDDLIDLAPRTRELYTSAEEQVAEETPILPVKRQIASPVETVVKPAKKRRSKAPPKKKSAFSRLRSLTNRPVSQTRTRSRSRSPRKKRSPRKPRATPTETPTVVTKARSASPQRGTPVRRTRQHRKAPIQVRGRGTSGSRY